MALADEPTASIVGVEPEVPAHLFSSTERYRTIARLCSYFDGTQYKGRPDFWTGSKGGGKRVPLRERAPCVIYPLPKAAVQQATRFTFGEGRYPTVKAEPAKDDGAILGLELSDDDAAAVTQYLADATEQAALRPMMRTLLRHGLASKTAVCMLAVRGGKFTIDVASAKDCWPKFKNDDPADDVESLVWCYRFEKLVIDRRTGQPEYKPHYFRRDITKTAVVVYHDTPVEESADRPPVFLVDQARSSLHGLPYCPVVWIRNMPEECAGDVDGTGLYDGLSEEFDALNFALSQRHRGIVNFGVPQPWETGVDDDDGPGDTGRTSSNSFVDLKGFRRDNPGEQSPFGAAAAQPARPLSPDQMWTFSGKDVKLGLLETTGKAFEVATSHVNDIQQRLLQAMGIVLLNPAEVAGKGDMSAKFLSMMYTDLLALVDDLRPSWWHYGLCRILNMILQATAVLGGERILLPGATKVAQLMAKRNVAFEGGVVWVPPKLTPAWGDYFSASNKEIAEGVLAAVSAKTNGVISKPSATAYVAPYFAIDNVDAEVEALTKEADQDREKALALGHAMRGTDGAHEDASGDAGVGSADQAANQDGHSSSAAASGLEA